MFGLGHKVDPLGAIAIPSSLGKLRSAGSRPDSGSVLDYEFPKAPCKLTELPVRAVIETELFEWAVTLGVREWRLISAAVQFMKARAIRFWHFYLTEYPRASMQAENPRLNVSICLL